MSTSVGIIGIAAFLPALICGGGMVLCMAMMGRGMRKGSMSDGSSAPAQTAVESVGDNDARLADLEAEVARLRDERDRRDATL
jgi:uncharacterized small protein (DUF1192 family)